MHPIRNLRLFVKKHFYKTYLIIRHYLLPLKEKFQSHKNFDKPCFCKVSHTGYDFLIKVNPENGFVDEMIYQEGIYEPDILDLIKQNLPLGGTFVDIGANIGQHSLFAACIVGNKGKVISFEPIPEIYGQFTESINKNNFQNYINVHNIACSNLEGELELYLREGNIGGSSFVPFMNKDDNNKVKVRVVKGDSILDKETRVDLIKIDTEGFEPEVIEGILSTLQRTKPKIIIEYSPVFWGDKSFEKGILMLNDLANVGYSFYDIECGEKYIENINEWAKSFSKTQTNLLCKII